MTTNPPHTIRKPVGVGFWTELGKGKEEAIPLKFFFKPSHGYGKFYIYFTLAPQRISYFTQWLPKAIFFILVGSNRRVARIGPTLLANQSGPENGSVTGLLYPTRKRVRLGFDLINPCYLFSFEHLIN